MNPLLVIGLLFGVAVGVTVYKTIKTAGALNYYITRFGIYQFASDGNLVFRVRIKFTNPSETPIHFNLIDIGAYLNSQYQEVNGKIEVLRRGNLIASLMDNQEFVIQGNGFTEKDFFINARWSDVGQYFLTNINNIIQVITGNLNVRELLSAIVGQPVLIYGNVKAEGVNIPIAQVIQLSNDVN